MPRHSVFLLNGETTEQGKKHCRVAAARETTGAAGQTSSERHTYRTSPRKPGQNDSPYYPQSLFTSFRGSASLGEGASKASNIVRITLQNTRKIILHRTRLQHQTLALASVGFARHSYNAHFFCVSCRLGFIYDSCQTADGWQIEHCTDRHLCRKTFAQTRDDLGRH